jgi:MFS family permease
MERRSSASFSPSPLEGTGRIELFLPLCVTVFLCYATLGLSLAALPGYVHATLGLGNVVVGVVIGIQSAAALATRHLAGTTTDLRGPEVAVRRGVAACAISGVIGLVATAPSDHSAALVLLLLARVTLGLGESLLVTGCLSWGIALVGARLSGKVMAWNGIAMYAAIAGGAQLALPLGRALEIRGVFAAVVVLPILGAAASLRVARVPAPGKARLAFYDVLNLVWQPGLGLALAAVGFGGIASFITLDFAAHGWRGASLALTTFGAFYVCVRLFLAHLPDRFGGKAVALVSLLVEVAGQGALWLAPNREIALLGAALTGAGFSLVFPSFGVEAIRRVAPANRGTALGAYVGFFDLALGATGPIAGLVANRAGYPAIYLLGGVAGLAAAVLAARMRARATAEVAVRATPI